MPLTPVATGIKRYLDEQFRQISMKNTRTVTLYVLSSYFAGGFQHEPTAVRLQAPMISFEPDRRIGRPERSIALPT